MSDLMIEVVYDNGCEEIGLYAKGHHAASALCEAIMVAAPDLGLDLLDEPPLPAEARARGETYQVDGHGMDPPSSHPDHVYLTTDRLYALFHASLYGRGDLYLAEPIGEVEVSTEDPFPAVYAKSARIVAVPRRGVLLRPSERRRLAVAWGRIEGLSRSEALHEHRAQLRQLIDNGGIR